MCDIDIMAGDITTLHIDAIVCPAHKYLSRGQGLSAQIHDQAGIALDSECDLVKSCRVGEARLTHAGELPARFIIHTVTPQWSSGDQWGVQAIQQLRQCYQSVLELARKNRIERLAFPALGAGCNRFPHSIAASVGLDVLLHQRQDFQRLLICLRSDSARREWQDTLNNLQQQRARVCLPAG